MEEWIDILRERTKNCFHFWSAVEVFRSDIIKRNGSVFEETYKILSYLTTEKYIIPMGDGHYKWIDYDS